MFIEKFSICFVFFISVCVFFAVLHVNILETTSNKLYKVTWNDFVGTIEKNLTYTPVVESNKAANKYDLYLPANLDKSKPVKVILYIHGGSFNSGSKSDGEAWCKFYTSKGYVCASMDYTLQRMYSEANLNLMNEEVYNCVSCINDYLNKLGYTADGMATCGLSAGGTLALNYAYTHATDSAIPVKFVFETCGPVAFEPSDWGYLKKANFLSTDAQFVTLMTGESCDKSMMKSGEYRKLLDKISPCALVTKDSVPTLFAYGAKDHLVPKKLKYLLIEALEKNNVTYDYVELPHSNHGMYNDPEAYQEFINKTLEYCEKYF